MIDKIVELCNQEIEKLEKQKADEYGRDIKPLHYMNSWDSNRLCYLNGKLETYKRIVKECNGGDTK